MELRVKKGAALLIAAVMIAAPDLSVADESAAKVKDDSAQKGEPRAKSKNATPNPAGAEKKEEGKKRFVDRDGDGIQDGMEHRFRRKKGLGAKKNWPGEGRHLKRAGKGHKQSGKPKDH